MDSSKRCLGAILVASFYFSASLAYFPAHHEGEGAHPVEHGPKPGLSPHFYRSTCPQADEIVVSVLKKAIAKEPRIAASLLRLLFHDCFVQVITSIIIIKHGSNAHQLNKIPTTTMFAIILNCAFP